MHYGRMNKLSTEERGRVLQLLCEGMSIRAVTRVTRVRKNTVAKLLNDAGMHMRRFTRLTNGFSKKIEAHVNALSLHFAYYIFVWVHQTLRMSPAIAAGVTVWLWEMADLVAIVEASEAKPGKRGPYKKAAKA